MVWNGTYTDPAFCVDCFSYRFTNVTASLIPESSTWLLLSLGIAGMVMIRRKLASRA